MLKLKGHQEILKVRCYLYLTTDILQKSFFLYSESAELTVLHISHQTCSDSFVRKKKKESILIVKRLLFYSAKLSDLTLLLIQCLGYVSVEARQDFTTSV